MEPPTSIAAGDQSAGPVGRRLTGTGASAARPYWASILRRSLTAPDSFAELFRRHAGAIGRYLARRIGPHDAEGVLADTFLEAFRQRARYDLGQPNALPWLQRLRRARQCGAPDPSEITDQPGG